MPMARPKLLAPFLFLLMLAFATCANAATPLKIAPVVYTQRQLANGLRVITAESHASPTVAVQVWYHVGSKDDPEARSGFAHLFEHLMFKHTKNLADEQFDRLTEDVGGANNAFTSDDVTAYHEVIPSNYLETLLWAEAERMANLDVDETAFRSERAVVEEEYRQRVLASPYGRLYNAIPASAYQVHPYRRPTIGSIEDLEAATLQNVIAFHGTYYRPDNATLVVTGDFDPAQLNAWVDRYFASVKRPATPPPRVDLREPAWTADRAVELHGPKVPLPAVSMTWLGPSNTSPDAAALGVAAALLALGDSSRLHESLVYRQRVATSVRFRSDLNVGPGLLSAVVIAAGGTKLDDVKTALQKELDLFVRQPVTEAQLAKAKTQLLTKALVERETPLGLGNALAEAAVLEGDVSRVNRGLDELQAVTAADVQRVMRKYIVDAHKVTIEYTQDGGQK